MSTNPDKLVNPRHTAHNGPVTDFYMSCNLCITRENGVVANLTIMRNVDIGHDPVIVADACDSLILRSSCMNRRELTNCIAITDD